MARINTTHAPILASNAQLLILPVNSAGIFLDPILARTKTLYPDNYQRYNRACRDGSLTVGSCLLHKRQLERAGLGTSPNSNQPRHIANLVVSNHPYHPTHKSWLIKALRDLTPQLTPLIRDQGLRRIAMLTQPLIFEQAKHEDEPSSAPQARPQSLDWQTQTLPLLTEYLQTLPLVHIELHLPKTVVI